MKRYKVEDSNDGELLGFITVGDGAADEAILDELFHNDYLTEDAEYELMETTFSLGWIHPLFDEPTLSVMDLSRSPAEPVLALTLVEDTESEDDGEDEYFDDDDDDDDEEEDDSG